MPFAGIVLHDLAIADVQQILDAEAERSFGGAELRRQLLLEARRLREIGQRYYTKAMADSEESSSAAIIFIKASERLATLTGMNAPIGRAVQVIHQAVPVTKQTSTEEIASVLDALMVGHENGRDKS